MSNKETKNLAAPVLSQAVDGKLSRKDIQQTGGYVQIAVYDFMALGDQITLHLKAVPDDGSVPLSQTHEVIAIAPRVFRLAHVGDLVSWEFLDVHYSVKLHGTDKGESDRVSVKVI